MGCLRGLIRLALFGILLILLIVGWIYRRELAAAVGRVIGGQPTALPAVARPEVGAPTEAAVASARAKLDSLSGRNPRDSIVLTANETASLVGFGLDWSVRQTFDSLRVELGDDRLVVHARLQTDRLPADALGPARGVLGPVEPVRIGGGVGVVEPGVADWMVDEFQLGTFPFPRPVIARLVQRLGGNQDGTFPIMIPRAVGGLRVTPTGVVVYRITGGRPGVDAR